MQTKLRKFIGYLKLLIKFMLERLKMVGIDGSLLSWTRNYLTTRRQKLRDAFPDAWLPVTSGGKGLFFFLL